MIDRRFGQLTVTAQHSGGKHRSWLCRCDCGNTAIVRTGKLGVQIACGHCVRRRHGHCANNTETKTYDAWRGMIKRCYDPNNASYNRYGQEGVRVCARWLEDFQAFLSDMGEALVGLTLEREDTTGDYTPTNCCWATPLEQGRNRRNNRLITAFGETKPLSVWAERIGINPTNIASRLARGWPIEEAVTRPPLPPSERRSRC